MKNRFIRMLSILCAIMLMTGVVSVWASAEEMAATPTDLPTSDEEEVVIPEEKPEEETGVPEDKEDGTDEEDNEPESPVDGIEVIITKSVRLGETWEGVTRNTKLTVLKLDLDKAQTIHLIVEGKNAWANIRKAEQSADNLRKAETASETKRVVITLDAEAGSYLITIGPVEPNMMAKVKATVLDNQAFAAWKSSLEDAEEEEPAEEPGDTQEEEPADEQGEEPETEPAEELTEEDGEEPEGEPEEDQGEEPAKDETAEEPDEEPAEDETAEEPDEEPAEDTAEEDPEEPEEEQGTENEPAEEETESNRSIDVEIKWDVAYPIVGDTAHFTATLNGYEDMEYTVQWQYSPDKETWHDIPGETETTMDMVITKENNYVYWRIIVYVEDDQEE